MRGLSTSAMTWQMCQVAATSDRQEGRQRCALKRPCEREVACAPDVRSESNSKHHFSCSCFILQRGWSKKKVQENNNEVLLFAHLKLSCSESPFILSKRRFSFWNWWRIVAVWSGAQGATIEQINLLGGGRKSKWRQVRAIPHMVAGHRRLKMYPVGLRLWHRRFWMQGPGCCNPSNPSRVFSRWWWWWCLLVFWGGYFA